jgi:uncharacterized protein YjbJ (UPF0337 family)
MKNKSVHPASSSQSCVTHATMDERNFAWCKVLHILNLNKMNTTELKGNWTEQKGKLKMKFAILTDNDLMFEEGRKEEMLGKLQIKLGKTKEELRKIIAAL